MDFFDKKEKICELLEGYLNNNIKETEVLEYIKELKVDSDFKDKELFSTIFNELLNFLPELSRKELKQRVLMMRSFIE